MLTDAMFGSLAAAIMGGLLFGTLITLLFIPVLYALFFHINRLTNEKISILIGAFILLISFISQEVLSLKQCREMALQYNKEWQLLPGRQKARDIWLKVIKEISFRILRRVGPVFIAVPVGIMV